MFLVPNESPCSILLSSDASLLMNHAVCVHNAPYRTLHFFGSFNIPRTTFLNFVNLVYLRILRLENFEMFDQAIRTTSASTGNNFLSLCFQIFLDRYGVRRSWQAEKFRNLYALLVWFYIARTGWSLLHLQGVPDQTVRNFRVLKSTDWRFWTI